MVRKSMKALFMTMLVLSVSSLSANDFAFEIRGLDEVLTANAESRIANLAQTIQSDSGKRILDRVEAEARNRILSSLRPYGYYQANATAQVSGQAGEPRTMVFEVITGPPIIINQADIRVSGPGSDREDVNEWLANWPLREGNILNQALWETQKQQILDTLDYKGFLGAKFIEHRIEIDVDRGEASLTLALETGPRAIMGSVRFEQDVVRDDYLHQLVRYDPGQPYDGWLVERLRHDIWKTGFYSTIEVTEQRLMEEDPPLVNINLRLEARNRDTWQSAVGYGSDTEARAQLNWTRHYLSDRGDSLGMGLGWQQRDSRFTFRTNYRIPRGSSRRSYWIAETLYRDEETDFQVTIDDDPNQVFDLTNGDIETYLFRGGLLNVRDVRSGYQQINETWFVQYLRENVRFRAPIDPNDPAAMPFGASRGRLLSDDNSSIAIGVEWDWPVISGSGFETVGHHEQLRMFMADDIWGSPRDFNQVYFSSRWNFMASENIKLLFRAEVGYSAADVDDFEFSLNDQLVTISLTDLPNLYRFKAGGSQSVRGYAYESLSDNNIGSNNLITFSAEAEWRFRPNWSLATFYDAGNAFNEWSDIDLRQGVGVGARWYSIAGAVRLDIASALDLPGDPWRVHFTLGVPLL